MIYYKVPKEMDNKCRFKFHRGGGLKIDGAFIKNELYTSRELSRYCVNLNHFEKVEIKKSNIYFSFGCRFEVEA